MTDSELEESGSRQLGPGSSVAEDDPLLREIERAAAESKPAGEAGERSAAAADQQPEPAPKGGKGKRKAKGTPAQQAHWAHLAELNRERAKQRKENKGKSSPNADAAAAATAAAEAELRGSRSSGKQHTGPIHNPDGSPAGSGSASSEGPKISDLELETLCKLGWWGVGKIIPKPLGGGTLEDEECEKLGAATMPFVRELLHTSGGPYGLLAVTVLGVFGSRAIAYKMGQQADGE